MKFIFGTYKKNVEIEAKNLEHAIKIFKVSELFPEQYVDSKYIKKNKNGIREHTYDHSLERYHTNFVDNPKIKIYDENDKTLQEIPLDECINVDFKEILPQKNLIEFNIEEKKEKEQLPVIGTQNAITQSPKIQLRKYHDQILTKRAEAEELIRTLNKSLNVLKKELEQKKKVVYVLETFLGIHEEVVQIQEGKTAEINTPLTLYQQLLYMDEEVGIWGNGGLDFETLDQFDDWIIQNYERYLYKPLSVCAFRIRRNEKSYAEDTLTNYFLNVKNFLTYFVIRNGENLYRIWSNVSIKNRLFPTKNEYQKIADERKSWGDGKEKVQDRHENYIYGLIAIQGIIERTDILGTELRKHINLTRPDGILSKEWVNPIRDDEPEYWLSDGKLSWDEFCNENRKTVIVGTRIVVTKHFYYLKKEDEWRCAPYRTLDSPSQTECYTVENIEKKRFGKYYKILYHSSDTIWDNEEMNFRPRKHRIPWRLYSDELLNFDTITVEDCEYYEQNRNERAGYLSILPTLHWIKEVKKKERKLESEFVKYIAGQLQWDESQYDKIHEAVTWWKLKNKWKRALTLEESTATRMIIERLKKSE